jgi:hypothetical protein
LAQRKASSVSGRDLARAISFAAGLGGEVEGAHIVAVLGQLAGPFMLDLGLSNFEVTKVLGWAPKAPSLVYELLYGTLKSP